MVLWLSWVEVVISLPCLEVRGLQMNHFFVAPGSIIKNGKYSTVRWWMTKSIHRPVDTSLMCQLEMFQKNPRPIHSPLFVIKNSTFAIVLNKMFLTTFFLPVIVRRDNPRFTKVLVPVGRGHPERKWRDTTRAFLYMRRRLTLWLFLARKICCSSIGLRALSLHPYP